MKQDIAYSFEFFPPKTDEGVANLRKAREALAVHKPEFFSVTFGAGGSTRDRTMDAVFDIQDAGYQAAPHISCISASKDEVRQLLKAYQDKGIKRLVTLRGDMPSGVVSIGDFEYANELVEFIRAETGDWFQIEVAAYPEFHPESKSATQDLQNFKRKVDAGANAAITQYFYNIDAYFRFVESCEQGGISIPIVPGIMPIYNYTQLARFSNVCGAEIPRWLRLRLEAYEDDIDSLRAFGADVVADLCQRLIDAGVNKMHFYTLNQAKTVTSIIERLK